MATSCFMYTLSNRRNGGGREYLVAAVCFRVFNQNLQTILHHECAKEFTLSQNSYRRQYIEPPRLLNKLTLCVRNLPSSKIYNQG